MQNEKELMLRRAMPAARTTRARSAHSRLRRELPCTRVVQIFPAAQTTRCAPHQALKGAILFVESRTDLT